MFTENRILINLFEKLGYSASFICAIHCTLMPILMTFLPLLGISMLADENLELILLLLSGISGLLTMCFGYKRHKSIKASLYFYVGFGLVALIHTLHEHINKSNLVFNLLLVFGSVLIIYSYKINKSLCESCKLCKNH
jgi:predicted membrane channel-forming protein YqfA (hemolysin III family)